MRYAESLQGTHSAGAGAEPEPPEPGLDPTLGRRPLPSAARVPGGLRGAVNEPQPAATASQFYGTVTLDPVKAKLDFATIIDEVVQQFTAKVGVEVDITVEIQAKSDDGSDESVQRTVRENCNVLRFDSSEFES